MGRKGLTGLEREERVKGSAHGSFLAYDWITVLRGTLGSSLRTPAEGEGHEGFKFHRCLGSKPEGCGSASLKM